MKKSAFPRAYALLAATIAMVSIAYVGYTQNGSNEGAAHKDHDHAHEHGTAAAGKQDMGPTKDFHLHLCAFHVSKEHPEFQLEAHHYCQPGSNGRFHQCVIYDAPKDGKIIGIEYIISDEEYKKLPEAEKKFWHPHAYEIMSGELVAPGLDEKQQDDLFGGLVGTWGKTWHTWPDPSTPLPTGEPMLMWSSGGAGQIKKDLVEKRDAKYGISTPAIGKHRQEAFAKPVPNVAPPKSMDELGKQW